MRKNSRRRAYWKTQIPVDYLDTSLVEDAWETVDADLSDSASAKIYLIKIEQTNNGATAEDLELEITINGTAYTFTKSGAASGTPHYCGFTPNQSAGDFEPFVSTSAQTAMTSLGNANLTVPIIADSVGLIRVRQTSNVDGVSAQIEVNIVWEKLVGG